MRRQNFGKITHLMIGVAATFALMGADQRGCEIDDPGETEEEQPTEELPPCPEGHHWDTVCDDHDCPAGEPGDCFELCVPDAVCPEGTFEEWICDGPLEPPEEPGPVPMGYCLDPEGCPEPPPEQGECHPICVPIGMCGPGEHEEIICGDVPPPMDPPPPPPDEPFPGDPNEPPPPDEPFPGEEPMPDEPPPPPPPPGEECVPICVPDLPENDFPCPPGTFPDIECFENDCWEVCVPIDQGQL
jgi:hypothetical protein